MARKHELFISYFIEDGQMWIDIEGDEYPLLLIWGHECWMFKPQMLN